MMMNTFRIQGIRLFLLFPDTFRIQGIWSFFLFPDTFRIQGIWSFLLFPDTFRKGWKVRRLEGWKVRRLEGWKVGRLACVTVFAESRAPQARVVCNCIRATIHRGQAGRRPALA